MTKPTSHLSGKQLCGLQTASGKIEFSGTRPNTWCIIYTRQPNDLRIQTVQFHFKIMWETDSQLLATGTYVSGIRWDIHPYTYVQLRDFSEVTVIRAAPLITFHYVVLKSEVGTGHSATLSSTMLAPVRSRWPGCQGGPSYWPSLGTFLLWCPSYHRSDDGWGAQRVLRVLLLVPKRRTGWEGRKECQSWAHFLARGCGSGMIWTRSRGPMGGLGLSLRFPRVCCLLCAKTW